MVKRKALLKEIDEFAKRIGAEVVTTEGGSHTKVTVDGARTVVPRHAEINEITAKAIRKQLGMEKS